MISTKKLIQMARKWQKAAGIGRKRISWRWSNGDLTLGNRIGSSVALKGHFVVYTTDMRRFVVPLLYLGNEIVRELLRISEEEFGIPSSGPIIVPIDALSMEYIISLIRRGLARDQENALVSSFTGSSCSSYLALDKQSTDQQIYVCS
ncbi:hypothetical protein ACJRO7_035045 [Eucalyptus globulus]|uniref:Uncharacterized protein n=1 Tax=Eucalyptus globulus TaxID=34317 RepID=A0ABD3JFC9_EUCGL